MISGLYMVVPKLFYFMSQVLKVDGAYVAVKFPGTSSSMSNQSSAAPLDSDPSSLLQDCRLLRIDELQVQSQMHSISLHSVKFIVAHNVGAYRSSGVYTNRTAIYCRD